MEEISDTVEKFKFDYEKKSYYVDRSLKLMVFNIPPKGEVIRVFFKRKRSVPASKVMEIFSKFPQKIFVKEDSLGVVVSFSTLLPAVECYKKMLDHNIFPSVNVTQMLSKSELAKLEERLKSCRRTLEPAFITEKKLLEEEAYLKEQEKYLEERFLVNEIKTEKSKEVAKVTRKKKPLDSKVAKNDLNHKPLKPLLPLDLKSVPLVNEQRYYPENRRFTRPYEPTAVPVIPKYEKPYVYTRHDREWLTPYVLYKLSALIFDDNKLMKFMRKIKVTEKTKDSGRLETPNSPLQYTESHLHEVLIYSEMCCEELKLYILKHFPNIYQINYHIRHGIYNNTRYILAYVKSSQEATSLVEALREKTIYDTQNLCYVNISI